MVTNLKNHQQLISIITPSWNRVNYLYRVWNGLNNQTYKNIEWIVCDDGSTDGTHRKLIELARKSSFRVIIITASTRIGKAKMDNKAIKFASGEFIVGNDSDDYLMPNAIERLVSAWNSIDEEYRKDYVGVTALCTSEEHRKKSLKQHKIKFIDTTWNEISKKNNIYGDMLFFTRAIDLKLNPFPEVDFVVPESVVWSKLGHKKTRFIFEILQVKEYNSVGAISFTGKMEYNRGRAHALAISTHNLINIHDNIKLKLLRLIKFIRYSIHGEIGSFEQRIMWGKNPLKHLWFIVWPLAFLIVLIDRLQGKVRYTHRDFLDADIKVIYNITIFENGVCQQSCPL
jgi:glycosyltransferase involved in cell wall biosynthesis